jgi:hypothetical protein
MAKSSPNGLPSENPFQSGDNPTKPEATNTLWTGFAHPFSAVSPDTRQISSPSVANDRTLEIPNLYGTQRISELPPAKTIEIPPLTSHQMSQPTEIPQAITSAVSLGKPIRFSSQGENAQAKRQPDFILYPNGELKANPAAKPNPSGAVNIEIRSRDPVNNKSLRDAIKNETDNQKALGKELIRLFQAAHPGQRHPAWMDDLANATANYPESNFVPFNPPENATPTPAPENGFVNRGVGSSTDGGTPTFANNGGFDGSGMFQGNGTTGDGTLSTGAIDSAGKPLGEGETVKAKEIYDYLVNQHHLNPVQASGILGNMQTESSFQTAALNHQEGAIGLCQWEGGRRQELEAFAAAQGKPVTDWHVQVDFLMHELKTTESGAWQHIQAARTPAEAAAAFDQYYERSAGTSRGERTANATNIYHTLNA